ncbi:hypothetical protein HDU97_008395, partial [Phlyctochytrium planicorne]
MAKPNKWVRLSASDAADDDAGQIPPEQGDQEESPSTPTNVRTDTEESQVCMDDIRNSPKYERCSSIVSSLSPKSMPADQRVM